MTEWAGDGARGGADPDAGGAPGAPEHESYELGREITRIRARLAELEARETKIDAAALTIAENSPDNIMLIDLDGVIRYINWTVPDLTRERVVGTPVFEYVPEQFRDRIRRCFSRVRESGKPDRYETDYLAADGTVSYWESRVGGVVRDGKVAGFAVISSNVTERREAAADRDRFFNLSIDMLAIADDKGYFRRLNPAFEAALGYTYEELTAKPFIDFVHPDDREETREKTRRMLEEQELAVDFLNRYQRKDGEHRLLSWRAVSDKRGKALYGVARDVTEQRALETALRHSQKMEAVGQLAGGVAHDFNNLLLVIGANCELARREADAGKRQEFLAEAEAATLRGALLAKQLLTFSRRQPPNSESVDLNAVVQRLLGLLARLLPETIQLTFEAGAALGSVKADMSQLEQVVLNLCLNARDAMPEGGRLTLRTQAAELDAPFVEENPWARPGSFIALCVVDNGVGIDPAVRERIFEPFFTTKEPGRGTGLGLSTVYGIVEQHRGLIDVVSAPGSGTSVSVFLPVSGDAPKLDAETPEDRLRVGKETVLVAEDQAMVRRVAVEMLQAAGYRVLTAKDGVEAVELFEERADEIELLLLDVVMPRLSGPDAYARILAIKPGMRALFTSGYSEAHRARLPEAADVLEKPYRMNELLDRVRRALDSD